MMCISMLRQARADQSLFSPGLANVRTKAERDARWDAHDLLRCLQQPGKLTVEQVFASFPTHLVRQALELIFGDV
jgi:hypothetical protein